MLLNYRKSGEPFENLLTMRYVRDSVGRLRFCIGFQLDLTGLEGDKGPWGKARLASAEGQAVMADARLKMSKLIQMLPKQLNTPVPETPSTKAVLSADAASVWSCAELSRCAAALQLNLGATAGMNWSGGLYGLLDGVSDAAIVVDMMVPMLPIAFANAAFSKLTGYANEEAVGRNCRFLQGGQTEGAALSQVIEAVRQRSACRVRITNHRKDGTTFSNDLTLHPIHDSNGAYRFSVGILADAAVPASRTIEALRGSLPMCFEADLDPLNADGDFVPVDEIEQWKQYQPMTSKLMRLLWSTDADGAMRKLLTLSPELSHPAIGSLGKFLSTKVPEDEKLLVRLVQQTASGQWRPMEGRTDQAYTSGSASALDDVGTPKSANTPTASDASRRQNLPAWAALATILEAGGNSSADGVSAQHALPARQEAARKLISNHERVLLDLTNASTLNIEGKPLTQGFTIRRLPPSDRPHVDGFLREVARRLLGRRADELTVECTATRQAAAWVGAATYLDARIQSTPEQKPGRPPDMSPAAAAAMKAVMVEISAQAAPLARHASPQTYRPPAPAAPVPKAGAGSRESAEAALAELASAGHGFQKWLGAKASTNLLDAWNETLLASVSSPEASEAFCHAHFCGYRPPCDSKGWMMGVAALAESLPLALTISDCSVAGFPLVYVNSKFTDVTGYTKADCEGRNCRFLQGPGTNPEHGQHLLDTLRRGRTHRRCCSTTARVASPSKTC